jgi:ornithine cyclodeaminase
MLILSAADVRAALPMPAAILAMKEAFAALSGGSALVPARAHMSISRNSGVSLIMPAYLDDPDPNRQALAVKVVSLFDGNRARGVARIQAAVLVLEPDTGRPVALLEGATLTAIRTAAASGAASDLLARPESRTLAVLGAGVQARTHIEAVCAVRPIQSVRVYGRTRSRVEAMIREMEAAGTVPAEFMAAASVREALQGADVVCATTTSAEPIFEDEDLEPGTHLNAVGSYKPHVREVPAATVARSLVVVDRREAAWEEAGDLIIPLHDGLISRDHIHAELGELVLGRRPGRTSAEQITFFKSVGVAVQDAAAARSALSRAMELGLGTTVPW